MAEVKNAFIRSKMNKDLDSRLVPSGEYRNALNAQVSKSEGSDVGALESALGNSFFVDFRALTGVANLFSIGHLTDEVNSDIYVFLTDNESSNYVASGAGSNHFIYKVNTSGQEPVVTKLVQGAFLNFSRNNQIYGVNILELLLFWTDNRNQPRKINVSKAASDISYYSTEDHVSVAKYNPYEAIGLYQESLVSPGNYETTMKDVVSKFLPDGGLCTVNATVANATSIGINTSLTNINVYPNEPAIGMFVKQLVDGDVVPMQLSGVDVLDVKISGYTSGTITIDKNIDSTVSDVLVVSPNPYYINNYNGDPNFLEDKFARFSYRFKFDDGEYSIVAPFTQPCFIPKQDGYFLNTEENKGDQQQAFSSTIVEFMENKVNNIDLQISLPSAISSFSSDFHVVSIDILYKESDGLAMQVIETIDTTSASFLAGVGSIYVYSYQSKKPYKTLPSKESIRVYDKVPVKALGQEIISNRVAYANFQDKHTPPPSLNYNVNAGEKSDFDLHSEAQASVNYEVTSPTNTLTLSDIVNPSSIVAGRIVTSVNFNPQPTQPVLVVSLTGNTLVVNQNVSIPWNGDPIISTLVFPQLVNPTTSIIEYPSSSLKTNRNYQVGFVLSDRFGRQSTVILSSNKDSVQIGEQSFTGSTLYSPYIDEGTNTVQWPGNSLKISLNDPIPESGPGLYNGDVSSANYNPLGWYSYKIVVKQTEQEYYNVYSAGAMKGLPWDYDTNSIGDLENNISFVSLLNDNINKVPRDLSEVGPQDKSFRSSVILYGRVENTSNAYSNMGNGQYYPGRSSFTTSSIEDLNDMFDVAAFTYGTAIVPVTNSANPYSSLYKSDSNPFIVQVSTSQTGSKQFGVKNISAGTNPIVFEDINNLTIFETKPINSKLDIFWETSSYGLISDINNFVLNDSSAGASLADFNTQGFNESIQSGDNISTEFRIVDNFEADVPIGDITSFILMSVTNGNNITVNTYPDPIVNTNYFTLYEPTPGNKRYNVKVTDEFINQTYYDADTNNNVFSFVFQSVVNGITTQYFETVNLSNSDPVLTYDNVADPATISISRNTGDYDLMPVDPMTAVNGASASNPNTGRDITWSIVPGSEVNSAGDLKPGTFGLSYSSTNSISTCRLSSINSGNIQADVYSVAVRAIDAGQAYKQTVISVNFGVIPVEVQDIRYNASQILTAIKVTGQSVGGNNGFYVYEEKWGTLSQGLTTIDMVRTGSDSCGAFSYGWSWGVTLGDALAKYWECDGGTAPVSYTTTTIDTTGFFFEIT